MDKCSVDVLLVFVHNGDALTLPNDKFFDRSIFKAFADDKILNVTYI